MGVDRSRFTSTTFGQVQKTPGRFGHDAFLPSPLPRSLPLGEATVALLSDADRAIGRLAGAGRLLPNPQVLVNAYVTREAVASSRIEGTQATISDVFEAATEGKERGDVREVTNYIRAMEAGLDRLSTLPLSTRLVEEIHGVLLDGVRGAERSPGEVRRSQNWIGSPDNRPETAVFVPPPVDEMKTGLSDWERFVHEDLTMPPLIRCALVHYQFETLHPFLDGNGRLGRLLIIFFLIDGEYLPEPLLYVSSYFETHKDEYYDRLQGVRERGEVQEWLRFFLAAIGQQANDAVLRAEALTDLREGYRIRLHGNRSRAHEIIDLLLVNPFVSTAGVARRLGVTNAGATNLLRLLESLDVIEPMARIPGRSNRWVATEVYEAITTSEPFD